MKYDIYNVCNETSDLDHCDTVEANSEDEAVSVYLNTNRINGNGTEVAVIAGSTPPRHPYHSENPAPLTGTLISDDGIEYEYDFS